MDKVNGWRGVRQSSLKLFFFLLKETSGPNNPNQRFCGWTEANNPKKNPSHKEKKTKKQQPPDTVLSFLPKFLQLN